MHRTAGLRAKRDACTMRRPPPRPNRSTSRPACARIVRVGGRAGMAHPANSRGHRLAQDTRRRDAQRDARCVRRWPRVLTIDRRAHRGAACREGVGDILDADRHAVQWSALRPAIECMGLRQRKLRTEIHAKP